MADEKTTTNMDIDSDPAIPKHVEEESKAIVVILVGAPGSGKSTFCEQVMRSSSTRPWARICQDTIKNGKSGTKVQCLMSAASALKEGRSVFIDRCNLDKEQRADFVKLGGGQVDMHAVVLDLPAKICISRSVKRTGHEGNLQGGKAAAVVNRMLQKKELPKLSEGFSRITICQSEADVQAVLDTYSSLGPSDVLPRGFFGKKGPESDSKVQLGIMKFLKKVDKSDDAASTTKTSQDSKSPIATESKECKSEGNESLEPNNTKKRYKEGEDSMEGSTCHKVSLEDTPTLAFPSISTADFQFDLDKASDIIVDIVEEFLMKLGHARLVLVDLSSKSRILSLVYTKAAQRKIDSNKFFTFVGDITRLYSEGGLHCNVIANASNWRLRPGGGGVNAAIFSAAGPDFESATKETAKSLVPGKAVVVPLSSSSPLFKREKVTHIIHVLGPNMNPQRPNCLDNDYVEGCKILRATYTSLFEKFVYLVGIERSKHLQLEPSMSQNHIEGSSGSPYSNSDQKIKRDDCYESDRRKKSKSSEDKHKSGNTNFGSGKKNPHSKRDGTNKTWGSWAQALHQIAMHPEEHKDIVLEIADDYVVINDLYPKAKKHLLVLARSDGLDQLADVQKDHLQLLQTIYAVGVRWAEKFLGDDASLVFRLGYHSVPSMRQLHLHVVSQDFDSKHLKNKKHWNSFNTSFFRDSVDIIEEVSCHGTAILRDDESLLSMELRCHRCRSAHPNIPRLKSHISKCQVPFSSHLLQNGRLLLRGAPNS